MPDLEARIVEWKRSLIVAFGGSEEIVEELESHLREEIDRLTQAGQSPDAALVRAQTKLGRPTDLAAEYARVAAPVRWLPIRIGLLLPVLFFGFCTWVFFLPRLLADGNALLVLHVAALFAGYAAGFYAALLGICYVVCRLVRPLGLGQRRSLGRALFVAHASAGILLLSGVLLGMVWTTLQGRPAWSNDPRELATALVVLWFAGLMGMGWLAPRQQHLGVLLSVAGSSVCVWGWFGPAVLSTFHQYGYNVGFALVLIAGTAVPLGIAVLGMLPSRCLRRQSA